MRIIILIAFTILVNTKVIYSSMPRADPEEEGMSLVKLKRVDDVINESIKKNIIPGAVLAVVRNSKLVYLKAYGMKSIYPTTEPMMTDTIFDLASMSKPIGTGLSMMTLLEEGKYRLTDNVSMYIPDFVPYKDKDGNITEIRIIDLLTHTSGLKPYAEVEDIPEHTPEALIKFIASMERDFKPGTQFQYSCLNFITLQNILQKITGEKLEDYAQRNIFDALGLESTTYNPIIRKNKEFVERIAPTEKQPDGSVLKGEVHDPLARIMNKGNSGNAGVFSTAEDVAIIASAMMNDGKFQKKRLIGKYTLETMTCVPDNLKAFGRSLSWDNYSPYASNNGNIFHPTQTIGHTGFTGTSIVIDKEAKAAVILLTHRVHPKETGSVVELRSLVANVVAGSILE